MGQDRNMGRGGSRVGVMSAYPSRADIRQAARHVRFVPQADIAARRD